MFTAIFDYLTLDHAGAAAIGGVGAFGAKYLWEGVSYLSGRVGVWAKAADIIMQDAEAKAAALQATANAKVAALTPVAPVSAFPAPILPATH